MNSYSDSASSHDQEALMGKERIQKSLRPKKGSLFVGIAFAVLTLAMIIAYVITGLSQAADPVFYDPTTGDTDYAYLDAQLLTECFAYSEENGTITANFYFVVDTNSDPFIVQLSDEQFASLEALLDYTYSEEDTEVPDPVRLTGIPRSLDSELRAMAIPSFNQIWNGEYVTEDNMDGYLGVTYLDCTGDPIREAQSALLVFAVFFGIFAAIFLITAGSHFRLLKKQIQSMPSDAEAQEVYAQAARPTCLSYPDVPLFLTEDYVIGFSDGIQIVPLADIRWIYPLETAKGRHRFHAVFVDTGHSFCVATLPFSRKGKEKAGQIASAIYSKIPDARFGYTMENRQAMFRQ